MTSLGKEAARFALVGTGAFLLDSSVLALLVHAAGWDALLARLVSISVAMVCAWLVHRNWTFSTGRLRSPLRQTALYGATQFIGLSINYAIFTALVLAGSVWRAYPVLAVAAGSVAAMGVTYLLSKMVAFAPPREVTPRKKRFAQG